MFPINIHKPEWHFYHVLYTNITRCVLLSLSGCNSLGESSGGFWGLPFRLCSDGWNMRTCTLCPPCCFYFSAGQCCSGYIRKVVVLSRSVHSADCTTHHRCISHLLGCNSEKRSRTVDKTEVAWFLYFNL